MTVSLDLTAIGIEEILYRAIKRSQPDVIRPGGKVSSALFKDDAGVSVDRKGGRAMDEALAAMKVKLAPRMKGAVRLTMTDVLKAEACAVPAPSSDDIYHAEIYSDANKHPLTALQAYMLSKACKLVCIDEKVAWVQTSRRKDK